MIMTSGVFPILTTLLVVLSKVLWNLLDLILMYQAPKVPVELLESC